MPQSDNLPPDEFSRGKRKEEVLALQKLGETLVKLPEAQLEKIEMPDSLRRAVLEARSFKSNEAKRRQLQYIGKLMRDIDPEVIQKSLRELDRKHEQETEQFHAVEEWRDTLIAKGDAALQQFMQQYPEADRQTLRQWIRKAQQDKKENKNTGGASGLFKYLRELM